MELSAYLVANDEESAFSFVEVWSFNKLELERDFENLAIGPARRRYADPIVQDLSSFLTATGDGTGRIVHVGPGGGKTAMAIVAVCRALEKQASEVYWVAHNRILLQQALEAWQRALRHCRAQITGRTRSQRKRKGYRDSRGRFLPKGLWTWRRSRAESHTLEQDDHKKPRTRVTRIHFLTHAQARKKLTRDGPYYPTAPEDGGAPRRLVVVDEVHWGVLSAAGSESPWGQTLHQIVADPRNRVIGLSATPRSEQLGKGGVWAVAHRSVPLRELTALEDPQVCALPEFYEKANFQVGTSTDPSQLGKLATWLVNFRGRNKKTLVLVRRIEQARKLKVLTNELLEAQGATPVAGAVHSEPDSDDLSSFRNPDAWDPIDILFAVDMLSIGFDVRDVLTIVLARPVGDSDYFEQCIGRGARIFGRAAGDRFRLVCTTKHQRGQFERLYGVKTADRSHQDSPADVGDSHRFQLNWIVEESEPTGGHRALDSAIEQIRLHLDDRWTVRSGQRTKVGGGPAGRRVRITSDVILHSDMPGAFDTVAEVLAVGQRHGVRPRTSFANGFNFTIRPFGADDPGDLAQRNKLARYLLLLTSYLEPAIVTLGSPHQYGSPVFGAEGEIVDYRIGALDRILPCTQALHSEGRPDALDRPGQVTDVFGALRRTAGEARDCSGIDVERLQDKHPDVWVRFSIGPGLQDPAGMAAWVDLWREIVQQALRHAREEEVWTLPAAPRRDSLLPTGSPRAWFSKLLPHMDKALLDRLVLASKSNRAHWAECGPSPAFWAELWP